MGNTGTNGAELSAGRGHGGLVTWRYVRVSMSRAFLFSLLLAFFSPHLSVRINLSLTRTFILSLASN